MAQDLECQLAHQPSAAQNHDPPFGPRPRPRDRQPPAQTTYSNETCRQQTTEIEKRRPRIVIVDEKGEGQQAAYQVKDTHDHLCKDAGKVPPSTETFQFPSEVKNNPDGRCCNDHGEIDKVQEACCTLGACSAQRLRQHQGCGDPQQIGGQNCVLQFPIHDCLFSINGFAPPIPVCIAPAPTPMLP